MTAMARVWLALGGKKVSSGPPTSGLGLVSLAKKGLPFSSLVAVAEVLGRSVEATAGVIAIAPRTLYVRKGERRLNPDESERVVRLAIVSAEAEEVLGSRGKAQRWLTKPNRALGGETPEVLLGTETGAQLVREELSRIDNGVFA